MRLSTLSTVAAVMMVLLWMIAATWRPHSLYAEDARAGTAGVVAGTR